MNHPVYSPLISTITSERFALSLLSLCSLLVLSYLLLLSCRSFCFILQPAFSLQKLLTPLPLICVLLIWRYYFCVFLAANFPDFSFFQVIVVFLVFFAAKLTSISVPDQVSSCLSPSHSISPVHYHTMFVLPNSQNSNVFRTTMSVRSHITAYNNKD